MVARANLLRKSQIPDLPLPARMLIEAFVCSHRRDVSDFRLRPFSKNDAAAVTRLSIAWNGVAAALPPHIRSFYQEINPNGSWILELNGRPEAIFQANLIWQPLGDLIVECPLEREKTRRHLLTPTQAEDNSRSVHSWIEFTWASSAFTQSVLIACLPRILQTLRPQPHPDDAIAGLLHSHFRRLPLLRQALHLKASEHWYPNYSDVVYTAPFSATIAAIKGGYWYDN
jgi:hypothetical protein